MVKTLLKSLICGAMIAGTVMFTSCSNEDEPLMPQSQDEALSRSGERDVAIYIDFEDARLLAGPTSYGANLYADYSGAKYIQYTHRISNANTFTCGLNYLNGAYNFYNGGIAISRWNIRSNSPGTSSSDWWYSYENQCSVYNTDSTDGANTGAGAGGSNTFAVLYGYQDAYNTAWMTKPYFSFSVASNVPSISICNTSYAYGVMKYGNEFGNIGVAQSLESSKGWFKVIATGYKADGTTQTAEKYICDYRDSANPTIPLKTTWETWNLGFTNVVKVEFNFEGSDSGSYGLNTPAYLCIDNIMVN